MYVLFGDYYYHATISRVSHAYVHSCTVKRHSHANSTLLWTFKESTPGPVQNTLLMLLLYSFDLRFNYLSGCLCLCNTCMYISVSVFNSCRKPHICILQVLQ